MDHLLISAFERDDPFTMDDDGTYYFNTKTLDTEWIPDEALHGRDKEDEKLAQKCEESDDWMVVPGTPHSEWHGVFKKWLEEIGMAEHYTTSIGLTLKRLDEIDQGLREGWYTRKYDHAGEKARSFIRYHKKNTST